MLERFESSEFPAGEVEPIDSGRRAGRGRSGRRPRCPRSFAELVQRVSGEAPDTDDLEAEGSYGIAARVELPAETKQALLELGRSPSGCECWATRCGALIAAVARSREIAERAKMNGKVIVG